LGPNWFQIDAHAVQYEELTSLDKGESFVDTRCQGIRAYQVQDMGTWQFLRALQQQGNTRKE